MLVWLHIKNDSKNKKRKDMSEMLSQNPDSSPDTTTDWGVLEGNYNKESDVNQVSPEATGKQFGEATRDVIAAREKLSKLSEASRNNPEDSEAWQATREQSVAIQALIKRRNELAERMTNEQSIE